MSLYQKYRPQRLADIIGQDHIKKTLKNAIQYDLVSHAYLFSGPRGTGKTSIARILAMAVNCLELGTQSPENRNKLKTDYVPCGQCASCQGAQKGNNLNIIEIDAASNRGIDEIRSLRDSINFISGSDYKKVFIIDEVHMLTKEAFNALLKTLEEPPTQVIFILATTELHKVPETIISRTQHFEFKRATMGEVVQLINQISKREHLNIDSTEVVELIATHAEGSFRDSLSVLDQLKATSKQSISSEDVRFILGIAPEQSLIDLLSSSFGGDTKEVHQIIAGFTQSGYDPASIIDSLITILQSTLYQLHSIKVVGSEILLEFIEQISQAYSEKTFIDLIEQLILAKVRIRWSPLPNLPLELILMQTNQTKQTPIMESKLITDVIAQQTSSLVKSHNKVESTSKMAAEIASEPMVVPSKIIGSHGGVGDLDPSLWGKVVAVVRNENAALAALLKSSHLGKSDQKQCLIEVPFSFYADRILDKRNLGLIKGAIEEVFKASPEVSCRVSATLTQKSISGYQDINQKDNHSEVKEVFGSYISESLEVEGVSQ